MRRIFTAIMLALFVGQNTYAQKFIEDQSQYLFDNVFHDAMRAKLKGDYQSAFDMLAYLAKQQPNNPVLLNELGNLLGETKDYVHAAELTLKAVEVDTTDNRVYIDNAIKYLTAAYQFDKVIPLYDKLLKLNPNDIDAKLQKYNALIDIERYEEALKEAETIKTEDPEIKYEVEIRRVAIYAGQKKYKKALKIAKALDKQRPNNARTIYLISHLNYLMGNIDEALALCDRATKCPEGDAFNFLLADMYRSQGMDSLFAERTLKGFASPELNEGYKIQQVSQLLNDQNILTDANWVPFVTNVFSSLLQQYPANPDIVSLADSYYNIHKKHDVAYQLLTRFVENNPGTQYIWSNILAYLQIQYTSQKTGDKKKVLDKILSYCARAREELPNEPTIALQHGIYLSESKQWTEALASSSEAYAAFDSNDPNVRAKNRDRRLLALNVIASCYVELDSIPQAFMVYDQILAENPDDSQALNNYAYYLALRGQQLDKAERMSMRSLDLDALNTANLDTYAYILFREEKYQEAMFVMERCMEQIAQNGEECGSVNYDHYGDMLFKVGRVDEAIENWQKALNLNPGNKLIERKINEKTYIAE